MFTRMRTLMYNITTYFLKGKRVKRAKKLIEKPPTKTDWEDKIKFSQYINILKSLEQYGGEIVDNTKLAEKFYLSVARIMQINTDNPFFYIPAVTDVIKAVVFWIERDKLLNIELSEEEIMAGAQEVAKEIGPLGVAVNIAQMFSTDPDIILEWPYCKVWNILKINHLKELYSERLRKVMEKKETEVYKRVDNPGDIKASTYFGGWGGPH